MFAQRFPETATPEQAAWVPLTAQREEGAPGVFRLLTRTPTSSRVAVVEQDATRIANAIDAAVRRGGRRPEDFLVLFRTRKFMSEYARALEERGIPYELSGGGAFKDSEELKTLLPLLRAISDPDDPVAFAAVLRGPLFGVDDEALYRHFRAGGRFSFRTAPPDGGDPRIALAGEILREGEALAGELPPGAAISRIGARLGWTAYAGARELGDSRAGNLLKAIAAARTFSADGLDFGQVVAELDRLTNAGYIEEMSARPGRRGAVRLMTVHGAKGLEAPVVFLADPRPERDKPVRFSIDRKGESARGHWRVIRETEGFGVVEIAEPPDWEAMQEREGEFDAAEMTRLLYVAATRASDMLVVSIWKQGKSENAQGPWSALAPFLAEEFPDAAPRAAAEPAPSLPSLADELAAFRTEAKRRRAVRHAADLRRRDRDRRGPCDRRKAALGINGSRPVLGARAPRRARGRDARPEGRPPAACRQSPRRGGTPAGRCRRGVERGGSRAEVSAVETRARLEAAARRGALRPAGRPRGARASRAPGATVLQGVIDLVFEEDDGWVLIDYKSDTVTPANRAALEAFYAPQIAHYRRYWERLTGRPTRAGLLFVATGELAMLSDASVPPSHAS